MEKIVTKRNKNIEVWTPPRRVVLQIGEEENEDECYQIALTENEARKLIAVLQEAVKNVKDYD